MGFLVTPSSLVLSWFLLASCNYLEIGSLQMQLVKDLEKRLSWTLLSEKKKKKHNLRVDNYVLFGGLAED